MGGRGGSSGITKKSGVIDSKAQVQTIETVYRESRGYGSAYYKDTVLEAIDVGNGEVSFEYATPDTRDKTAKTNRTQYVTFRLKAGAKNDEVFGVNWDNVKSVSGQTYGIKSEIKNHNFIWDGKLKKWVRKS